MRIVLRGPATCDRSRSRLSHGEWAFLSSLVLHAAFLGGIIGLNLQQFQGRESASGSIDTLIFEHGVDVSLNLEDGNPAALPSAKNVQAVTSVILSEQETPDRPAAVLPSASVPQAAGSLATGSTEESEGTAKPKPGALGIGTGFKSQVASFFQIPIEAKSVVYVIDRSGSMGLNDSLGMAKEELLASLRRLPEGTRFQIIAYNRTAEPIRIQGTSGLTLVSPEAITAVEKILHELRAEGGTNHMQALKRALLLRADVVFYLTDGDDLRQHEVDEITRANQSRSVIHAVVLNVVSSLGRQRPLGELARANRGVCRLVVAQP